MNIDCASDIDPTVFADALLSLKSSRYHDNSVSSEDNVISSDDELLRRDNWNRNNAFMSMQNQSKMRKIDPSSLLLSSSSSMMMTMVNPMLLNTMCMDPMIMDKSSMFMDPMINRSSMFTSSASSESSDSLQTLDNVKLLSNKVSRRGRYKCSRCGELKTNHVCAVVEDKITCSVGIQVGQSINGSDDEESHFLERIIIVGKKRVIQ